MYPIVISSVKYLQRAQELEAPLLNVPRAILWAP